MLYIFVLSNYFCKYNSKKIFEKVKINMQTSRVNVLYSSLLFFVACSFCSFYDNTCVGNISKVCALTPTFKTIFWIIALCLNTMRNLNAFSMVEIYSSVYLYDVAESSYDLF